MLDKFSAILHDKWRPATNCDGFIVGTWAEDGSSYTIECPSQLRDLIVELQNILAERYLELENKRDALTRIENKWKMILENGYV